MLRILSEFAIAVFVTLAVADEPIKAPTLHAAFLGNQITADTQYKDKPVTVIGIVVKVEKRDERYVVILGTAAKLGGAPIPGLIATIAKDALDDFKSVNSGAKIVITGTCRGLRHEFGFDKSTAIVIEDCRLVK